MFIDQARIFIKAGSGGNGCTSFFRSKQVSRGKATGGDGGNGGNIIIQASKSIHTLLDFHYNRHFKAERGQHGSSNNMTGRTGKDLVIRVPCGTTLTDAATGLPMRDLVVPDTSVIIAKGGKGGKGNSRRRASTFGENGEEKDVRFELKLIADVGIIGFPNAGKSTFISKVSKAKSKVADYPFTTKQPILGMVRHHDNVLTFADMPGLIDGAHMGRGLGDRFLRHIERTRILLHMVDIGLTGSKQAYEKLKAIEQELSLYGKNLIRKKRVIAFNKIDMLDTRDVIADIQSKVKDKVFPISSLTGEGINELLGCIFSLAEL